MGEGPPTPTAEGTLTTTPFGHVLLYVMQRKMSGTLVVWPAQGPDARPAAGQDRIRIEDGWPVAGWLITPASTLARGLLSIFNRTDAPYAFYETDLVGEGTGVMAGRVDPMWLMTASLRGAAREDLVEGILARYGDQPLRIHRAVELSRYGFEGLERDFVELLRAAPASVPELIGGFGDKKLARRLLYLLLITKALEPYEAPKQEAKPVARAAEPAPRAKKRSVAKRVPPPSPPPELSADLVTRWKDVQERVERLDDMNYFEMLGVSASASAAEVREAYFDLAKTWHPDRLPTELGALRSWVDEVFFHLTKAKEILMDPADRGDYVRAVESGGGTPAADRKVNAIVEAAMEFQKAEVHVRRKEWDKALERIKEALDMNASDPDYHALEGWILLNRKGRGDPPFEQMHEAVDRALELNEESERANFYKGMILKKQGRADAALTYFRRVVKRNPKHIDAMREVRLANMRENARPSMLSKLFGGKK